MIGSNLVAAYRRDGFIVVPDVLDADTLAATRCVSACNFDPLRRGIGVQN